jgi:hypothetical protein
MKEKLHVEIFSHQPVMNEIPQKIKKLCKAYEATFVGIKIVIYKMI